MDSEQIVARGQMAARLLGDEQIMSFFNELKSDIKEATFLTTPDDVATRERLYFQMRGVDEVLAVMTVYKNRAEEILNPFNTEE